MKFYTAIWLFIFSMISYVDAARLPSHTKPNTKVSAIVAQIQGAAKKPKVCAQHCTPAKCYQDAIANACIAKCPPSYKKSCDFVKKLKMRMIQYKSSHSPQGIAPDSGVNSPSGGSSASIPVKTGVAGNLRVCISVHPQGSQENQTSDGQKKLKKQHKKQKKNKNDIQEKKGKPDLNQNTRQEKKQKKNNANAQEKQGKQDLKQSAKQEKKQNKQEKKGNKQEKKGKDSKKKQKK